MAPCAEAIIREVIQPVSMPYTWHTQQVCYQNWNVYFIAVGTIYSLRKTDFQKAINKTLVLKQ